MDSERQNFRAPKTIPAKNKTPAPIQITAEQLLREAKERQLEYVAPVKKKFFSSINYYIIINFIILLTKIATKTKNIRPRRVK